MADPVALTDPELGTSTTVTDPPGVDVVLFVRRLGRSLGGGSRAVLFRANIYARLGYRVTLVVVGPADEAGAAYVRREGLLDRAVRVLFFGREAPDLEAEVLATFEQPLAPPVPLGPNVTSSTVRRPDSAILRRTYFDDGLPRVTIERRRTGELVTCLVRDDQGQVAESWRFSDEGLAQTIDRFDEPGSAATARSYVVGGSLRWLDVDLRLSEGRGPAVRPYQRAPASSSPAPPTFAQVIAAWLDEEFEHSTRLVVMADGENTAQHVLRAMRHPYVLGVCVLHNAHMDFPHTDDAPVKPHWSAFLEDPRNVRLTVCLTARQRQHLEQRYPELALRIVHHAVPEVRRTAPETPRDRNKLVFVGRLVPQKRLDHLVEAFALVAAEVPEARLEIVGSGAELEPLRQRVAEHGLADRVTFPGYTDDAQAVFASAAAAVMSSLFEGLPLTLTEAMSVGTPFVAYDINYGPAEVIRDGIDGLLVPPGDVQALAAGMVRVLRDPVFAASLQARALDVLERFSSERYERSWVSVLDDVLAEAPARREPSAQPQEVGR